MEIDEQNQNVAFGMDQFQQLLAAVRGNGGNRKVKEFASCDSVEWSTWRTNFTLTATINGWDDRRARREVAAAMSGGAKLAVADLPIGDEEEAPEAVGLLLDAYEARFMPVAASDAARQALREARQMETEAMLAWHARLRHLYQRAHPEYTPEQVEESRDLREVFMFGIRNRRVAEHTCMRRPGTYHEAFEVASSIEASARLFAKREHVNEKKFGDKSLFGIGRENRTKGACHYCHETGHFRAECPKKAADGGKPRGRGGSQRGGSRGRGRGRGSTRGTSGQRNGKSGGRGRSNQTNHPSVNQMEAEETAENDEASQDWDDAEAGDDQQAEN
jgi:uncharacterized membrane protein YgcG